MWRHLNLTLPEHYGMLPMPLSYGPRARPFEAWERSQEQKAEERYRERLKHKIHEILEQATELRCEHVRSVKLVPRPEAVEGMLCVLNRVSPRVTSLEICAPEKPGMACSGLSHRRPANAHETLDHAVMELYLHLPALKHLRLADLAIYFEHSIAQLCDWAPNLTHVDVDYHPMYIDNCHDIIISPAQLDMDTKIEVLSMTLRERYYRNPNGSRSNRPVEVLLSLLERSPRLHQLDLRYIQDSQREDIAFPQLVYIFKRLGLLRDLCWRISSPSYHYMDSETSWSRAAVETSEGCLLLRRLLFVDTREWMDLVSRKFATVGQS